MRALISLLGCALVVAAASLAFQGPPAEAELSLQAAFTAVTIDGDDSDWADIEGLPITLAQFEIPGGSDWEYDPLDPVDALLKAATDGDNLYLLFQVSDDYDYDPEDSTLSPSPNVMFLIDPAAGPHMGAGDEDFEQSLGMVDIWHWELDCGPGNISGGGDPGNGDDPDCNLDDEFSTEPEDRDDDGDGSAANTAAENSISAAWEHTARADGPGSPGTWTFEYSRPLETGDPEDAQFALGSSAFMAVAYFDPDESAIGWSDAGHLTSADLGWIEVLLPSGEATPTAPPDGTPEPTATPEPAASPTPVPPAVSDVEAEITMPEAPRVGDPASFGVTLRFTEDGSPVVGAKVALLQQVTFLDVEDLVELAGAVTDESGYAEVTYTLRRAGDEEFLIQYLLPESAEPVSTVATLTVADGGQVYRSVAGVDIPGLGVWVIIAVASTVWAILLIVAVRVIAIARAGGGSPPGPADGDVGRLAGTGRLGESEGLSEPGALEGE